MAHIDAGKTTVSERTLFYSGKIHRVGEAHAVDSDAQAFEIAASKAFKEAVVKGKLKLLELIMKVEIDTPKDNVGDVIGDITKRRGNIKDMITKGNSQLIKTEVPLDSLFGYITNLRSITQGRASAITQFNHYQAVSPQLQESIVKKFNY
jgi:elongation factor G